MQVCNNFATLKMNNEIHNFWSFITTSSNANQSHVTVFTSDSTYNTVGNPESVATSNFSWKYYVSCFRPEWLLYWECAISKLPFRSKNFYVSAEQSVLSFFSRPKAPVHLRNKAFLEVCFFKFYSDHSRTDWPSGVVGDLCAFGYNGSTETERRN